MGWRGLILGLLLFAAPAWAMAQTDAPMRTPELNARAVWQGFVKSGSAHSEVRVRYLAFRNGQVDVAVSGSSMRISRDFPIEPGQELSLSLPLLHAELEPLQVAVHLDGELLAQRQLELILLPASARLVAIVSGVDVVVANVAATDSRSGKVSHGDANPLPPAQFGHAAVDQDEATLVHITPGELPEHGQSYAQLSALVLPGSVLAQLGDAQLAALGDYLSTCGPLFMPGAADAEVASMRDIAGCGGRAIFAELPASGSALTLRRGNPLPGVGSLRLLFPAVHYGSVQTLLVFLVGYLGLLLLAARSATHVLHLLVLPPVATALALLAWSLSAPFVQIAAWAEMESGDSMLRYVGLMQVNGTSRRQVPLQVSSPGGVPLPVAPSDGVELRYDLQDNSHYKSQYGGDADLAQLRVNTRLLSQHEFVLSGTAPGVQLDVRGGEKVSVVNRGTGVSPAALIAWRGQRFSVPQLAAGQRWQPPAHLPTEVWGNTPQEQLLRQRAIAGGTWLLMPVAIAALRSWQGLGSATSWLLVKGAGDV